MLRHPKASAKAVNAAPPKSKCKGGECCATQKPGTHSGANEMLTVEF